MILLASAILILTVIAMPLRGGALHNHLVSEAEILCRAEGFTTAREHPESLPDGGTDFIDLAAWYGDSLICIEVETSARNVTTNALKAWRLGRPLVVLVPTVRVRRAVQAKLRPYRILPGGKAICVLLLAQLRPWLRDCLSLNSPANAPTEDKQSNPSKET